MNNGNGVFSTAAYPTTVVPLPLGSDPVAMAVAGATPDFIDSSTIDFNGDTTTNLLGNTAGNTAGNNAGHLKYAADIVIANSTGNNVIVLLGNGDGTFQTPVVYPVGNDPVAVALGDFNNDSFPDIITANETGNSVSVLLNNPLQPGTFSSGAVIPVSSPVGIAVGDFEGDGNPDLDFVTATSGLTSATIWFGEGNDTFPTLDSKTIPNLTAPPSAFVAGDFDGDGSVDIAFTEQGQDSIGVLDNKGGGNFAAPVDYPVGYPVGESPTALVTGNLNGEQTYVGQNGGEYLDRLDLVAIDTTDPTESQFSVLLGQKFTTTTTLTPNVSNITWGGSISVTPVVSPIDAPVDMPLTGTCQLVVDGNPYGVAQPVGSTFVLNELLAGPHTLGALFFGDLDYQGSTTTSTSTINVAPAELIVTANNYSRAYGAADPTSWPYTITGFVNGDGFEQSEVVNPNAPANNPLTKATDTGSSSSVGNYTINIYQFDTQDPQDPNNLSYSDPNYVIDQTFNPGILTVTPAALTITANNASKTYGQTASFAGTAFTTSGLVNGDTVGSVTETSTGSAATAAVGTDPIVPSAATFSAGLSSNYTITYANGTLTVNPAALTITANNATKTYGQTASFPGTAFTASGLVNGDTVSSVTETSTGSAATAAVGDRTRSCPAPRRSRRA